MKKSITAVLVCIFFAAPLFAQDNNPLIDSREIINQAVALHDSSRYKEALELYKKINRSDTNYVWSLYESALTYAADSQYAAGIQACKLAMQEKSDLEKLPELLTEYGSLLDNSGEPEKSIHIFDSAINLYPAYSPLYYNKGIALLGLKKLKEAEQVFKQTILLDPYHASSHFRLGIIALQSGKLIPATLCFMNYLLLAPSGRFSSNCISLLSAISKNTDDITTYTDARTEDAPDEYRLVEKIVQSKIALDKNYKTVIELDDPISRQLQVMLEKLSYSAESEDFWMQYYLPLYKNVFTEGKFEALINYMFSSVNIPQIQNYLKKNKKEIGVFTDEATAYLNKIRSTRELNYSKRNAAADSYYYENGKFSGVGKTDPKTNKFTGNWVFYYSAGNIKSKGSYNRNGEREGSWIYYFLDGSVKATQDFINGKQTGNEKFYFQGNAISSDANYKDDNLSGETNYYFYAGAKKATNQYTNGKLSGERRIYYSNGTLKTIENYTDDKLDGVFSTWYKTGQKESEGTYVKGLEDGPYKIWFENGKLSTEGQYTKDNATGTWKKYHENGKLKSVENFVNGKNEGEYAEYHNNGQLFTKSNFKKGSVNGEVTYNDDDGKPYAVYVFDDNKIISAKFLDKAGKVLSTSLAKDKKIDLATYYTDGTKKGTLTYDSKGNATGHEEVFFHCGKTSQTNEYVNGQLNGITTTYHLNGQKSVVINYTDGKKDGYYQSFYTNGTVESEGWYKENLAEGQWLNYDELGNRVAASYFYNDELNGHKDEFYLNGKKEYDTKYYHGWIESMEQYDTSGRLINTVKMNKGTGRFNGVHLNGKLKFEGAYVNGDFDGIYKQYFFDGTLSTQRFYNKGDLDSTYKDYFYGGKLSAEGRFKFGKKIGTWKFYNKKGFLKNVEEYTDGELNGKMSSYYENGNVDVESNYVNGQLNGDAKTFEPGGMLAYQIKYKNDLPVSYTYLNKEGKPVEDIPLTGATGKLKTYYSNGQPSAEYNYVEGKIDGSYRLYYPNGKLWIEREDKFDITNGPLKIYYNSGQPKSAFNYLNNNLHGPYKEYSEKGIVTEEGNYYNGNYHGDVKRYDGTGKLIETLVYYYGNLLTVKK